MRLEWLEDILAVAQTGSFSEAAERRHLTQSAFSRRIGSIESHVGFELFDRSRKPVQLRPTTRDQYDQITRLVADLHQLVTDLRQGDRKASNRIVIASQHALTTALTPALLDDMQSSNAISLSNCGRPIWMNALRCCCHGRRISRWSTAFQTKNTRSVQNILKPPSSAPIGFCQCFQPPKPRN